MTDLHPSTTAVRHPTKTVGSTKTAVHVHIGGRWIAGQAITQRNGPTGGEVLVSHHGHLVWVDRTQVRVP